MTTTKTHEIRHPSGKLKFESNDNHKAALMVERDNRERISFSISEARELLRFINWALGE